MKKTASVAATTLILTMVLTGGVAYGRSTSPMAPTSSHIAPASGGGAPQAIKLKKDCLSRACAFVAANGSLMPGKSHKGVVSVTRTSVGQYCVELASSIPASTATPVAAIDFATLTSASTFAYVHDSTCGTNGVVVIVLTGSSASVDSAFTIAVP